MRLQKPVSRPPNEKLIRAYAYEAVRLRDLAAAVTTGRLKARLLEEATNQERFAEEAKRGTIQPHARRLVIGSLGRATHRPPNQHDRFAAHVALAATNRSNVSSSA